MEEFYDLLKGIRLFEGLNESDYEPALNCLNSKITKYKKGHILQLSGDSVKRIGIVLVGCIEISRTDFIGNRLIVNRVEYPAMFGEAFAFAEVNYSPVTLTAIEDSIILNLDFKGIISHEEVLGRYYKTIMANLLSIMAQKNLFLSSRLELVTKKTTRSKIAAYLLNMSEVAQGKNFEIPYNRNQLADYLSVNRSAMSNELSKLRQEGILDFQKNSFIIYKTSKLSDIANNGE